MEVDDPISTKFRTIVEGLMMKMTSEIVKVFTDVIFETRIEISRSWKEIDDLKQNLEQKEKQRGENRFRNQMTQVTFKSEEDDVELSSCPEEVSAEVQITKDAMTEEINTCSVSILEQASPRITAPETSELNAQGIELETTNKSSLPSTSHKVLEHKMSATENKVLLNCPVQQLLCSTGLQITSNTSQEKEAVLLKKKREKNKSSTQSNIVTHSLRDRHLLSIQKPCLCCTPGQCSEQQSDLKKNSPVVSYVYTCTECGTKFKEMTELKSHKCPSKLKCSRCGQTLTSLKALASHNRRVPLTMKKQFPFKCYLCDHMFATQCGWNIHKRIHAHGHVSETTEKDILSPSNSLPVPNDLKAKVEVRLERISEAQLEAALFPKDLLLDDNSANSMGPATNLSLVVEPTPFTAISNKSSACTISNAPMLNKESASNSCTVLVMGNRASSAGAGSSEIMRQLDEGTEDSVFPTATSKNHQEEKWTQSKSLIARRVDSVECDEGSSSASEDLPKGLSSLSRKRKMSDCNHDVYNGVFPVEKILRWRNSKGRNEVRIKWMPCSLCGAKWKNTWEPAESFISYKDDKHEENDKQN